MKKKVDESLKYKGQEIVVRAQSVRDKDIVIRAQSVRDKESKTRVKRQGIDICMWKDKPRSKDRAYDSKNQSHETGSKTSI